jgi:serine protease
LAIVAGGCLASLALAEVHVTTAGASLTPAPLVANPFSPATGHDYRHGVVPTISRLAEMKEWSAEHLGIGGLPVNFGSRTLAYGGGIDGIGVTSGAPKVYLVFWGSQWGTGGTDASGNLTFGNDPNAGAPYIQNTFKGLGTGGELWSGVMTQYCDGPGVASGATSCPSGASHVGYPTGGALAGAWYDNSAATPAAATSAQIAAEAVRAAAHFGNQTQAANRYAQYVILSPHGANPDSYQSNGFCAWHDYISSSYGDIAYTNMPYVMDVGSSCGQGFVNSPGILDGYSMVSGHEYSETVTDQNPAGGWTNQQLLSTYGGEENADECAWISSGQGASANVSMATGTFAMQSTWSNDTNRCDLSHPIITG